MRRHACANKKIDGLPFLLKPQKPNIRRKKPGAGLGVGGLSDAMEALKRSRASLLGSAELCMRAPSNDFSAGGQAGSD